LFATGESSVRGRRAWLLGAGLVLLGALALRVYGADAQSLWYDEGSSVALAARSLGQIAHDAAHDIHPPLYYWLLALWVRLAGDGVVALRGLSALIGTGVVAWVLVLGRRLFSPGVALGAGLLAAVSPYLVWYSQEVRMYILAAFWACALVYAALRLAEACARDDGRVWRWTLVSVLIALGALYTHYFGGASTLVIGTSALLVAAAWSWQRSGTLPWRLVGSWVLAMAVAVLAFLPWLAYAWPTIRSWPAVGPTVTARLLVWGSAETFSSGIHASDVSIGLGAMAAGLAIAGVIGGLLRPRWRFGALVVAVWALTPTLLTGALSLVRSAWNPKFLIAAAPAWELAWGLFAAVFVAQCIELASRRSAGRILAAVVVLLTLAFVLVPLHGRLAALHAMYTDPTQQRDDYRGIARFIDDAAGANDAVILNAPTQVEVYDYYDRGRHVTYPLPAGRPADRLATEKALADLAAAHQDLFGVLWATDESDPEGIVEGWLNLHRYKASDSWHGGVRLVEWAARRPMANVALDPEPARFGDAIVLTRLARPSEAVMPGELLTFEAEWGAVASPAIDYVVLAQLLAPDGRLVAQRDLAPSGGSARTSTWRPGMPAVTDRMALRVPAGTPPGDYTLILGLYDPATGARLPVMGVGGAAGGDRLQVGTVHVG
jgi:hypothetical protein